jgi:WD40 repeat protein
MTRLNREEVGGNCDVSIARSPNPISHLLATTRPATVRFQDTEQLQVLRTITIDEEHHVRDIKFSPDGTTVVTDTGHKGENSTEFWLWKVSDGTLLRRFASAKIQLMYALT